MMKTAENMRDEKYDNKLLGPNDPPPYTVFNEDPTIPIVIIDPHSSDYYPENLNLFGMDPSFFKTHNGIDHHIGAVRADMVKIMDRYFGYKAAAIRCNYSRIVVEANRAKEKFAPVVNEYNNPVRLNMQPEKPEDKLLWQTQKKQRYDEIYWPYQSAAYKLISKVVNKFQCCFLFDLHSLTPYYMGKMRNYEYNILHFGGPHEKAAKKLIRFLAENGLSYSENEPYDATKLQDMIAPHGSIHGIQRLVPDMRSDAIDTKAKQMAVAMNFAVFLYSEWRKHENAVAEKGLKNLTSEDSIFALVDPIEHPDNPLYEDL